MTRTEVIAQMRAHVNSLNRSPMRKVLDDWTTRLECADEEAPPEEPVRLHGIYDCEARQRRERWTQGVLQDFLPRRLCPSHRPWGRYSNTPD